MSRTRGKARADSVEIVPVLGVIQRQWEEDKVLESSGRRSFLKSCVPVFHRKYAGSARQAALPDTLPCTSPAGSSRRAGIRENASRIPRSSCVARRGGAFGSAARTDFATRVRNAERSSRSNTRAQKERSDCLPQPPRQAAMGRDFSFAPGTFEPSKANSGGDDHQQITAVDELQEHEREKNKSGGDPRKDE